MTTESVPHEPARIATRAEFYRRQNPAFARWAAGYGVIRHSDLTQVRVYEMSDWLAACGTVDSCDDVLARLSAADRLASAGIWLAEHMIYARRVRLDGGALEPSDFKDKPEGHSGGSLNMVIAYTGYLAVNSVTGITRSWIMGQGHTVSAIDAVNLLYGNMTPEEEGRYNLTDEGLSRFTQDFYLLKVRPDGTPESPLGSHVNAHTAGGMMEGGYLGFAELYYPHMPLPGDRLVAFLSDGAHEEQRGADWAPRWWRAEDTGLVTPVMIANGRRIDQRTTISMRGGVGWFRDSLRLYSFDPIDVDGCDPAAYAWAIWEMEERLQAHARAVKAGRARYPVPLPFAIAEVPKGFGFANAGTNAAHNLPLGADVRGNPAAVQEFNASARRIWVPLEDIQAAVGTLRTHDGQRRPLERDHPIITRFVETPVLPEPEWLEVGTEYSPMRAVDGCFVGIVTANPSLRVRVGNPDEMRSNRMDRSLDLLKHRVTDPEAGVAEAVDGRVITVLNEEAVVSAALANKGGLGLVATYEAFGVKMLGAIRQELIFSREMAEAGRPPGWLSIPVICTSHTWENAKNERSHQDPSLVEALMGEMTDVSRVIFPADANSAMAALETTYGTHGQVHAHVVAKGDLPVRMTCGQARQLMEDGGIVLRRDQDARLIIAAVGGYQLSEAWRAADRLAENGVANTLVYLAEPARFRAPRDARESEALAAKKVRGRLFPGEVKARVFITHTRPEPLLGIIRPLDTGPRLTRALGFANRGGTFDVFGMFFANGSTWAHAVTAAAQTLDLDAGKFLDRKELAAVHGKGDPYVLR